jgi:hypothetical protein
MKKRKNLFDLALQIFDTDEDGIPDWTDCVPNDPKRQHHPNVTYPKNRNIKKPRVILYRGFNVNDYYFVGGKYELNPNAKPVTKLNNIKKKLKFITKNI